MQNTLIKLAEIHYEFGTINHDEFNERVRVALWLADELDDSAIDPRASTEEDSVINENNNTNGSVIAIIHDSNDTLDKNDENWIEFLCLGVWVFTKSDLDSYPSIPHGHSRSQNKKWPKLNPYTGRVFVSKYQEDEKQRLSKIQMRNIWSDEKFKSFCREMIVWYQEKFPYYEFPVRRPLRMPRW